MTTGEILKKYIPKNAKNKNIALILNVKPQYLSNVLSDIKKPSDKFLNDFFNMFNVSVEDIEQIKDYEKLRKIPKEIRKNYFEIEKNTRNSLKKQIQYLIIDDNGIRQIKENLYFGNTTNLDFLMKADFIVKVDISNCPSFFKDQYLIFQKYNGSDFKAGFCILEKQGKINIYNVKKYNKKYIIENLNKDIEIVSDINILGVLYLKIVKEEYNG